MLKVFLGCILSLGLVSNVVAYVFEPKECPGASQFAHSRKGYIWSLPAAQIADWRVEVFSGPGNDSELTSMNDQTDLEVHLIPAFSFKGVSGLICRYTLSDQTILNVHARHMDSLNNCFGASGNVGNFMMKNTTSVNNSAWHRFWGTTQSVTFDGALCHTSADFTSYCDWSEAMTSNPYGVLHFCNGTGVPTF